MTADAGERGASAERERAEGRRPAAWEGLAIGAVFLLALLLRVVAVAQYEETHPLADRPVIDEASYETWALEIAGGDWLGDEVFFQEPLYPYWLGTVYRVLGPENRAGVRQVQAFLGAVTVLLVHLLARRLFGPAAGLVAGLALATHRPALLLPALLLKPNLVLPVVAALALALTWTRDRARAGRRARLPWLVVGALAGAGALLRGNLLLLAPLFVALPLLRAWLARRGGRSAGDPRRAAGEAALVAAGVALLLVPVAARNAAVGGTLVLTTSGAGTNVYGGNNAENPYGRATEFPWVRGIPRYEADDWRREAERRLERPLEPDEVSRYWLGETARSVLRDPGLHARILWNKLRLTLGSYEVPDNHDLEWDVRHVALLRAPLPGFALWGGLGLAGLLLFLSWRPLRRAALRPEDAWELAGFAALYVATIVLTVTSMRVRLAIVPLVVPFAGAFVRALALRPPPARLVPAALVAALAVGWPVFRAEERAQDLDKRDFNHAVYLYQAGERERAEELVRALDERYPNSSRVLSLRAQLEFERGMELRHDHPPGSPEEGEGRELIHRALARLKVVCTAPGVAPRERHRGRLVSAHAQEQLGNFGAAENHYRAALEFDPENPTTRLGLASALLAQLDADDPPDVLAARRSEAEAILASLVASGEGPSGLAERLEELRAGGR